MGYAHRQHRQHHPPPKPWGPSDCLTAEKQASGFIVTCHALQEGQGVADSVASRCSELTGIQQRIDRDDLLEQAGHDPKAVPEDQRKLGHLLPLFA